MSKEVLVSVEWKVNVFKMCDWKLLNICHNMFGQSIIVKLEKKNHKFQERLCTQIAIQILYKYLHALHCSN